MGKDAMGAVAAAMHVLGDLTRLRLLLELGRGEANVSALCGRIGVAQPGVSHHLGILRAAGFVRSRRHHKQVFYRLAGPAPTAGGVTVTVAVTSGDAAITAVPR